MVGLIKKMTFQKKPERTWGANQGIICWVFFSDRRNNRCKGPGAEMGPVMIDARPVMVPSSLVPLNFLLQF